MTGEPFELLSSETVWQGKIAKVQIERFRHADGEEVTRERVVHPGAAAIVAHDGEDVWMVRQPREAVREPALLELPAGKLDVDGEPPLETAKRELAEEIGKEAESWRHLTSYWSSPGFTDERIHIYLATELRDSDERPKAEDSESIEIVPWPLTKLDELIDGTEDGKSLIGLLLLRRSLR